MSAILDLLTRRVEEKGISKMILDIKEEMEEIARCEEAKSKFDELLRFYTYYCVAIPHTVRTDMMVQTRMNRFEIESNDAVRPAFRYDDITPTLYGNSNIHWNYILFHMGNDIKRIPAELYKETSLPNRTTLGGIYLNEDIQYLNEDIIVMRETYGCSHV